MYKRVFSYPLMLAVVVSSVSLLAAAAADASVSQTIFDLEDQPLTGALAGDDPGALTSLTLTQPELSMTITRPGDPNQFDVYDLNDNDFDIPFPTYWGERSISPWFSNDGTAYVADFSKPVQSVLIDMGDFGGDADNLFIEAYSGPNASGTLLDSMITQLPGGGSTWTGATLSVATTNPQINSIRFMGGDDDYEVPGFGFTLEVPNSVYYDNFSVVVPEPSSLALFAGLAAFALRRRR